MGNRQTDKTKLNDSNHSIKSGFSINDGKDNLTPVSQLPFNNNLLGTRPFVHKQQISSFHQQQQQISSFYTPEKRKKVAIPVPRPAAQIDNQATTNLTPLAPKVDPDNILNSSNPLQANGTGPNDGTFIQNITNNYILEKKTDKLMKAKDETTKDEQPEKQQAKEQETQKDVKCHCHLSKQQAHFGTMNFPHGVPGMHHYPYHQMYPYNIGYFHPYMPPYGMPPMPPYGYYGAPQRLHEQEPPSRSRSPVGKEFKSTNVS